MHKVWNSALRGKGAEAGWTASSQRHEERPRRDCLHRILTDARDVVDFS